MKMKICTKCGDEKPLDEYYVTTGRGGKKGRSGRCKTCICEAQKSKRLAKKKPEAVVYINGKETKFCNTCETHKYLEDFGVLGKNKDGRNTKCRACQKEYLDSYYANEDNRKKKSVTTAKRYREQLEKWSKTDLKTKVCRSCCEEKSLDEFYAKGRETQCKACKCQEQKDKRKPHLKRKTLFLDGKEAKLCRTCDTVKMLEDFAITKRNTGQGRTSKCKDCQNKYSKSYYAIDTNRQRKQAVGKEWREANIEEVLARAARYREENREKINKTIRDHYQKNKDSEHYKKVKYEYYENNKEKKEVKRKEWRENNREKVRRADREYKKNNPQAALASVLRGRLNKAIKKGFKTGSAVDDLGCSIEKLMKHLESKFDDKMNWQNRGKYWQIDHIYPMIEADLNDRVEFLAVNNWRNLQPLSAKDNISKHDEVTPKARKLFNKLKKEFSKEK